MALRKTTVLIMVFAMLSIAFVSIGTVAENEPNNDFASAELIEPGPFWGNLDGSSDLEDYYKFNMTAGDKISISFTCTSNIFTLDLYNEDESWLAGADGTSSVTNYLSYMTSAETTFTSCYLVAATDSGASGYSIETFTLTHQDDGGQGVDAPASYTGSLIISEGTSSGEVNSGKPEDYNKGEDNMDCYKFWAGMGDRINISFITTAPDFIYMNLREPDEDYIFQNLAVKIGTTSYGEWWTANETAMGWFYIEVYQDGTPGHYSITLVIERQSEADSGEDAPSNSLYALPVISGNINGHLEDDDTGDTFKFQAGEGDVINIAFVGYSAGDLLYIDLLGSDGSVLVSNKSSGADSGIQFQYYTANETAIQNFFLKAWMDTASGEYVITLGIEKQNDAGLGIDLKEGSWTGTYLLSGSYEGWIFDLDTADMYMINLTGGDILSIAMTISYGESASWTLYNETLIGILDSGDGSMSVPSSSIYYYDSMMAPQTCYLKIYNGQARYSLGIALSRQNDAGSGTDASGTLYTTWPSKDPFKITLGTYSGFVHSNGDTSDSYIINVTAGNRLNITVTPNAALGINAMLYGDGMAPSAMDNLNALGVAAYLQYDFAADGWAQFIVQIYSGGGAYSFIVSITEIPGDVNTTPSAPVLIATPGAMKVTLTWTAPADNGGTPVTGYNIYRKEAGSLLAATLIHSAGAGILTYDDTYIILGKTYEYYVKAENAVGEGAASNSVSASPLAAATDTDGDGIPDEVETANGLSPSDASDAAKDKDGDGYSNLNEYTAGSKMNDKNSTPLDFDGDGMPNTWEIKYEFNPTDPSDANDDPDNDGRDNLQEYKDGTNPKKFDVAIEDDDANSDWLIYVGACCGVFFLGLIVLLIIVLLVVASRKKKKASAGEE